MGTSIEIKDLKSIKERFSFEGKKGFVTGAGGGIGRTTAAALAELGGEVALLDVNLEKAQANAEEINKRFGNKAFAVKCDVTDPSSIQEAFSVMLDRFGEINFVHSNAGIMSMEDNGDISLDLWNKMINVNLTGMMLIDQAAARQMKAQGKGGAVVNTASMSGHVINRTPRGMRSIVGYSSTKGGVLQLTRSFAMDYVADNIRFNSISPGTMFSGIHDGIPMELLEMGWHDVPMDRFGTMDEIGGIVAFLLSDLATYITGCDVLVDGGYTNW